MILLNSYRFSTEYFVGVRIYLAHLLYLLFILTSLLETFLNSSSAEIFVYKPREQRVIFNLKSSWMSFRFISVWRSTLVVRIWRQKTSDSDGLKSVPALKGLMISPSQAPCIITNNKLKLSMHSICISLIFTVGNSTCLCGFLNIINFDLAEISNNLFIFNQVLSIQYPPPLSVDIG